MGKRQTVIRVVKDKEHPYVMLPRLVVDDTSLSWKARGILHYLIGRPSDWTIIIEHLVKQATDGKDSLMAGLKELKKAGYVQHFTYRYKGVIQFKEYQVYEHPVSNPNPDTINIALTEKPETENPVMEESTGIKGFSPETDFPDLEKPDEEKPDKENPRLLNNDLPSNEKPISNETTKYPKEVVVEFINLIEKEFGKKLSANSVKRLMEKSISENVNITDVVKSTKDYYQKKDLKISDLVAVLSKGIEITGSKVSTTITPKLPKVFNEEYTPAHEEVSVDNVLEEYRLYRSTEPDVIKQKLKH